ncbi:carbohydrate ABC transporter membrane protein 2, CUT1 family (plasmid) [Peptoclostridium acidaminophilum DSM 3953]|uniref:Carbohydrate ABC transporter membrane protein 2, CUT1 family n=1 Tax=Peptoclostridium acidaminophilum DSM 3953 TaxID=1286171 RepID=W8TAF9_PEPAC|nr:carbohydrate ABC transporter permease [Peptoclostridium acidaminophilum]AHM57890.1 carbohydrate ABC transporter membrane protein 2, CUT1 family [Peptoclostridium acidaminophilum DSM 3953]
MKLSFKKLVYGFVIVMFLLFTLGPILWCFTVSISPESEMFGNTTRFLPENPTFENYIQLLDFSSRQGKTFLTGLGNSMKAVSMTLLVGLPVSLMTAYALSRFDFKYKRAIRMALLITIVIPVFTTIIPLYAMFAEFGILDNIFWLSLVYVSSFLPMVTWVLSNYMNTIPSELDEAAFLDGCGRIKVFFVIILPNSIAIIFAIVLMIFLMTWNQYQIPLILASSLDTKPLSMIVADFTSKDLIQYGVTAAAGILALLPPAVVAIVFRKSLILGLTQGSVKG